MKILFAGKGQLKHLLSLLCFLSLLFANGRTSFAQGWAHPASKEEQMERKAFDLFQGGKVEESLSCHKEIRKHFAKRFGTSHQRYIQAINRHGWTYHRLGQEEKAEKLYLEALALAKKSLGADHPESVRIVSYLAENDFARAKYKRAIERFTEAIKLSKQHFGKEGPQAAESLSGRGRSFAKLKQYELSVKDFERAVAIFESTLGSQSPPTLYTKRFLAFALLQTERKQEAEAHFSSLLRAIDASNSKNPKESAILLEELADLKEARGDLEGAASSLARLLKIYEQQGAQQKLRKRLSVVNTLAALYTHLGKLAQATDLIARYRLYLPSKSSFATKDSALLLLGFSSVLRQMGHLDEAYKLGRRALAMALESVPKGNETNALFFQNMALIALSLGNPEEAREYYDQLLALPFTKGKLSSTGQQLLLFSLAGRAFISDENQDAREKLSALKESLDKRSPLLAVTNLMLALLQLLAGHKEKALSLFASATNKETTKQMHAIAHLGQGKLHQDKADYVVALKHYKKARKLFEESALRAQDEFHALAQRELIKKLTPFVLQGALRSLADKSPVTSAFTKEAFHLLETVRSRTFLEELSESQARQVAQLSKEELRELWSLDQKIKQSSDIESSLLLRQEKRELNERLSQKNETYRTLRATRPISCDELQAELAPNEAGLAYFQTQKSLYLFVIEKKKLTLKKLGVDLAALQRSVRQYRIALTKRIPKRPFIKVSHRLHQLVIGPLSSLLANKRLIILPHGCLLYVPFAALLTDDTYQDFSSLPYLFLNHEMTYAPSASTWLQTRRRKNRKRAQRPILAFASPSYTKKQQKFCSLPPLPATSQEAKSICALWSMDSEEALFAEEALFVNERASEQHLVNLSQSGRLAEYERIHLACHGMVPGPENVKGQASLALAPTASHDGFLTTSEIYGLCTKCELIVLSACQTAYVDEPSKSQGIGSLARAFFHTGTVNFVGSLWPVADKGTQDFMAHFYKALQGQKAVDKALRQARQEQLQGRWNHPYFWSAFILMGP